MHYRHTAYRVVRPAQIQQMIVVKVPLAIWKKKTNMFICGFVLMILCATCTTRLICSYPLHYSYSSNDTGFKITAGQQTISGQNGVLTAKSSTPQSCWPVGWRKVTNGNTSVSGGWYNLHSPGLISTVLFVRGQINLFYSSLLKLTTIGPFIRAKIRRVLHKTRIVPFIRACLI